MISVEFSLKEEMLVVLDEVHETVRTVETLIMEKSKSKRREVP